ncbi:dipeptide epimerase [Rossellomorea aquimaris]|uniref:Dipeptide epimerase n=1 Tax=Rossellomorea aquimaris TaxID=189382 RepID=A0A5D4UM39_9BACI|nr:dipeptide epimerase [Rossellomorea aquimaris]TYS81769.1 dipeptide epimerase [Rossellomorea aquimaris]TYS88393.1 dipeptide epimerase [Rossellomorea aquimaris]
MNIQSIQVRSESLPLKKPFKTALRTATEVENVFVYVRLEDGLIGVGAAAPTLAITGESKESIKTILKTVLTPLLLGQDIRNIHQLSLMIERSCVANTSAKAALEIALYDALCQHLHLPLYQYLGGRTNKLTNDMTVSVGTVEEMREDARQIIKDGFSTLKIKVGKDWIKDVERIKAIREEVGKGVSIRVDANQGWTPRQAVSIIQTLEQEDTRLELIEQPVHASDIDGFKFIRQHVNTPIMADESLFSPQDALRLIKEDAVDFLNIKLMKTGGIRRAMQIADMAERANIPCMIGSMMESSISVLAAAHIATAHPNIQKIDLDAPLWLANQDFDGIEFIGDEVRLTSLPGLGLHRRSLNVSS